MKNKIYISIILVVAILFVANLISQSFFLRLDFSEDKQYTLSKATKNLLKNMTEPVTVKAYFTEGLPPQYEQVKKDFKDMLIEYNSRSKGMLVYEFVNPSNENEEQDAQQNGVQPIMIAVREKDQAKQQKAYLGAVVTMGEKKEALPLIQSTEAMEYELSKAIKKLSITEKPEVGLLQGHGEPGLQEIVQAYNELSVLYDVTPLTLSDTTTIPDKVKTIIIVRPKDSIPAKHFEQLDNFLNRGGKILIAYSRVLPDFQNNYAGLLNTGLESWLKGKGVTISDNIVIDASCSQVQAVQQTGGFQMVSYIKFPYIPIIKNFAKNEITGGIEAVVMPFASTIEFSGDSSKKFIPIAFTSEKSGVEPLPVYFNGQRDWKASDFPKKNIPIAALLEGKLAGDNYSKMVIIADGEFIIGNPNQQQNLGDNINLIANSVDWLSDDTGLASLRTKSVTLRPIKDLSDGTRATLKWLNFLLPIVLVIIYGFVRSQVNRKKRNKRMEENYV